MAESSLKIKGYEFLHESMPLLYEKPRLFRLSLAVGGGGRGAFPTAVVQHEGHWIRAVGAYFYWGGVIRQQHDGEVLAPGLQVIHKITQNVPVYVFDGFHLAFYVSRVAAFVRCFYVNVYEVEATIEKFQRLFALCGEVCALCACCAGHEGTSMPVHMPSPLRRSTAQITPAFTP